MSESFFGFHFDFHATAQDKGLGEYFDGNMLDVSFCSHSWITYIYSKGHPGYYSYPLYLNLFLYSFGDIW